eukprot:scaffold13801_cov160-Skeletonema_menzelii.AAC.6
MMIPTLLLAACTATNVEGFTLSPVSLRPVVISPEATTTSLYAKRKLSMKERRKQRAKKLPSATVDRGILNDLPAADKWEKTEASVGSKREDIPVPTNKVAEEDNAITDEETEETIAKASSLVQAQRKSVDCLTHVRKRVEESFPINEAAKSLAEKGYFVYDGFLSKSLDDEDAVFGDAMLSEMLSESSSMLENDQMQRDISRIADGEFVAPIVGGENYALCPRLTEYVVSMTRHLPPLLNKEYDVIGAGDLPKLDSAASMGSLRLYDRKTKLGTASFLANPEDADSDGSVSERPFGVVCGDYDGTENDTRRLTSILYLSSKQWDSTNGGGLTMETDGQKVEAIRDRIVLFRSDTCAYRQEPWVGSDDSGLDQASCAIVHFIQG